MSSVNILDITERAQSNNRVLTGELASNQPLAAKAVAKYVQG